MPLPSVDEDPLGGVAEISGESIVDVEVINFSNPRRLRISPAARAISTAEVTPDIGGLRVVKPEYLVLMKLVGGSYKDLGDAVELIKNSTLDTTLLTQLAAEYSLTDKLTGVLEQAGH